MILNGQEKILDSAATLAYLVQELGLDGKRIAIEVNREIVPRSQHGAFQLKDQDSIEVVNAIGGG